MASLEKIGRNEPCICGSGKKYKKCCLEKDRSAASRLRDVAATAPRSLEWLADKYPEHVRATIENNFYGGLKKSEKETFKTLTAINGELLNINIGEWLLTDATFDIDGKIIPVTNILLATDGPPLSDSGRSWLKALGEFPLSLYELREVRPGEGMMVSDLLRPDKGMVWVDERSASRSLVRWDVIGARIVNRSEGFSLSGAVYPFERDDAISCQAKINRKTKGDVVEAGDLRDKTFSVLVTEWIRNMIRDAAAKSESETSSGFASEWNRSFQWADEPNPRLNDKTPRQAVKTAAGKRAVAELLKMCEIADARFVRDNAGTPFIFSDLWRELGLSY
jgi:hypothetical protein